MVPKFDNATFLPSKCHLFQAPSLDTVVRLKQILSETSSPKPQVMCLGLEMSKLAESQNFALLGNFSSTVLVVNKNIPHRR